MVATKMKLGAELLKLGKTKLTKKLKEADEKIENLLDKKKGTSKKTTQKEKKQLQKNIDANKGKVTQIKKRASNLKKKQTKPKQEVETSTKLASKEQIQKFKKQQQSLKKLQSNKAKQNRAKKQSKSKAKTGFVLQGKVVDKTPKLPIKKKESKALTIVNTPSNKSKSFGGSGQKTKTNVKKLLSMKSSNIFSKAPSKKKTGNILSRNKKKLAALAVAGTLPFAIDTKDSKVKSKNITNTKTVKNQKSLKDIKSRDVKTYKTKSLKEKKRTNITAGGNTGFGPKGNIFAKNEKDRKRLMDLYGGTGSAAYKAAVKGTQGNLKVAKKSAGGNLKSLKDLPSKSENPGIHMLPAKAKMNMGFKPMFGGGLVASFYDKAEKGEKHKGNTSVARQIKGYGKAKKKT
jgi:hypothetical protein|tara:strand:+ start:1046 stop:2251 length:1206 start_codon:yes stop_codon:yes gene_type:complete